MSNNPRVSHGTPNIMVQYVAMATGSLSAVTTGMNSGWPSISLPQFFTENSTMPITDDQGSWMAVMTLIGAIVGTILVGMVVDVIGRKRSILISTIPSFATWIIIAFTPSASAVIAARFIAGVAGGSMLCGLPMYLGEIADPRIRGFIGSSIQSSWFAGILSVNVIGSYLDVSTTALVASAVPILCLLTFSWMPESPYYFIMKGQHDNAKQSLRILKGTDNVEQEFDRLSQAVRSKEENKGKYFDLFTVKSNRKALLIILMVGSIKQLSGIIAIMFYTKTIFEDAGTDFSSNAAATIFFALQMLFSLCSSLIVDRTGRRPLAIISIAGSGLALLVEAVYYFLHNVSKIDTSGFNMLPVITLIVYIIIFSLGMQVIPTLMIAELFATNIKAFALILTNTLFCALGAVVTKLFQFTKDEYGLHVPFFAFSAACFLGLILFVLFLPETTGKTLEEIQQSLKGGTSDIRASYQPYEWHEKTIESKM